MDLAIAQARRRRAPRRGEGAVIHGRRELIERRIAGLSAERRAYLERLVGRDTLGVRAASGLIHRSGAGRAPLSHAQQRLWFLERLEPGTSAYTTLSSMRWTGRLDPAVLERCLGEVVCRHDALRTTFTCEPGGEPVQVIGAARAQRLPVVDLATLSSGRRAAEASRLAAAVARQSFDLERGPLLRAALLRLGAEDAVLLLAIHHIVTDSWSTTVLAREVSALYDAFSRGLPSPLTELPVQYADFALWQRERLQGGVLAAELEYWRRRLAALPVLCLPADRPRPATISGRGVRHGFTLPASLPPALKTLCRRYEVTLFMALLAGFLALLHRYTGQDDLVVGLPVSQRTRAEIEDLIGFFVNVLVLRTDLAGDPAAAELLVRVRETAIGAFAHQELPFELLVEELRPARDLSRNPLFQVMFQLLTLSGPEAGSAAPVLSLEGARRAAICDLACDFHETRQALGAQLEYSTDLFDHSTIARLAQHLTILLGGLAAHPEARVSELPLLSPAERLELAGAGAAPGGRGACSVPALVREQARIRPAAPAVLWGAEAMTYADLVRQAATLAAQLRDLGVGPEDRVGICLERTPALLVALLAVLAAGAAFLPLDPGHPLDRLTYQLADARAGLLLAERRLAAHLCTAGIRVICPERGPGGGWSEPAAGPGAAGSLAAVAPERTLAPGTLTAPGTLAAQESIDLIDLRQLAYVLYTSGSSGRPKAVQVPHGALLNHALAMASRLALSPSDRVLQFASVAFDVALEEIFPTLAAGAAVVLPSDGGVYAVSQFGAALAGAGVTVANLPASFWHEWVRYLARAKAACPPALRLVVTGSERVSLAAVADWRRAAGSHTALFHAYGVTEATVTALVFLVPPAPEAAQEAFGLPIGLPIDGVSAHLLDRHGNPLPVNVPGELWLGGEGLARGYLGRPELTADRFRPDPFAAEGGARLYGTGDLAKRLASGDLQLLGRIDQQIKLRGVRIEPGEIEGVLACHPDVLESAVAVRESAPGDSRLVAYAVARPGAELAISDLRRFLGSRLPASMAPSAIVRLGSMPRLASGKVDRRALPEPEWRRPELDTAFAAPRGKLARQIAEVWQELLRVEVGMDDNFFDLGGRSLLLIRVHDRLCERLGRDLRLLDLFRYPTVGALAAHLSRVPRAARRTGGETVEAAR